MVRVCKQLLALVILLSLLGPTVSRQVGATPGAPLDVGVYEEDFTTYTYKDQTENTEWDIWASVLRMPRLDGLQQANPSVAVSLPDGSLLVVWEDQRNVDGDIYAQRLDTNGNKLWAADVRVNSDAGTEWKARPAVGADASGNAVIVWQDDRNTDWDIYAQKLDSNGNKLWAADVRVNSDTGSVSQSNPAVGVDGSGHAVVVWEDSLTDLDVCAQRLDASGNRLWVADVRVDSSSVPAVQVSPSVALDASGNGIVVWVDNRNGDYDMYAQKLDTSGNKLWVGDARANSEAGTVFWAYPAVAVDGSGNAVVVWTDERNSNYDIYAQKLDSNGNKLWAADVRVNSDTGTATQEDSAVAMDGSGNAVVVWADDRGDKTDIYGQKLDGDGNKVWTADVRVNADGGMAVSDLWRYAIAVAMDGSGNAAVVWPDERNGDWDIYAQMLDPSANRLWAADLRVNAGRGTVWQERPAVAMDGSGNTVIVWGDERSFDWDVYAQKLDSSGNRLWTADLRVNAGSESADQHYPALGMDGSGNWVVVWEDGRYDDENTDIYAQRLDTGGNRLWTADVRVNSDGGTNEQSAPAVGVDGSGNGVVVWTDDRNGGRDIYAQMLDVDGNKLWTADLRVNSDTGTANQKDPAVAVDASGSAIVVWCDRRSDQNDIYAQKLDAGGNKLWAGDVRVNSEGAAVGLNPAAAVAVDESGNAVILWNDWRNGNFDIYAQRLDGSGNKLWTAADLRVNSDTGTASQYDPAVAVDGSANATIVWKDNRSVDDDDDIYAQKLTAGGDKLWTGDLRVDSDSGTAGQHWPAVAVDGSGNGVVAWDDERNRNSDIYAQKLDTNGDKVWMADVQVVYPDLFYFPTGTAQSRSVDATDDAIVEATLTAQYTLESGSLTFFLTNDGGSHWTQVSPGVTHAFTTTGSDLRWRVEMASDPVWRHRVPIIDHLRIEYTTASASGDDYEPDETCAQAQPIQVNGVAQQHTFHQYEDYDWAWFDATAGSTYIIQVTSTGSHADTQIELYDQCGQPPAQFGDNAFGPDVTLTFEAPASGTTYVKVSQSDGSIYGSDTEYELSVRTPTPTGMGAASIVAGRNREDDPLQPIINATANLAYRTFLRGGFTADDVMYLNADGGQPGVDDVPSKANIRDAIQDWARTRVGLGLPLWVYLADHGQVDRFHNDVGETVTAAELNLWLSNIEATSGVDQVNVVIDACHSGSFIDTYQSGDYGLDEISGHGRVVVGSTTSRWFAYAPYIVPGQPVPLMYFSDGFWHALDHGHDVWSAFLAGRATVEAAGQLCGDYDYVCQRPWLDDTGDAWFDAADGQMAQGRGLAASFGGAIAPYIDWLEVSDVAEGQATISAQVRDDGSVTRVWARVFAPSFEPPESTDGSVPIVEVPEVELYSTGDDAYQLEYSGFIEAGMYQVVLYALDDEGNAAMPKWVKAGESVVDTPLKTVTPLGPVTYGDQLTYTVVISATPGTQVRLFDPLEDSTWVRFAGQPPGDVTHVDSIRGTQYLGGVISGTLEVTPTNQVTVSFVTRVAVPGTVGWIADVTNRACVFPLGGTLGTCTWSNEVTNPAFRPYDVFLPLVLRTG